MMKFVLKSILFFGLLTTSATSFASSEGVGTHGGDACDHRLSKIRTELATWIHHRGSSGLDLSSEGILLSEYNRKMLKVLEDPAVIASCIKPSDRAEILKTRKDLEPALIDLYTSSISGIPKTCVGYNPPAGKSPLILCDFNRFYQDTIPADQYWLTHHEFAGISYLEKNIGPTSYYSLSDQITQFLEPTANGLKLSLEKQNRLNQIENIRFVWKKNKDEYFWFRKLGMDAIGVGTINHHQAKIGNIVSSRNQAIEHSFMVREWLRQIEASNQVACKLNGMSEDFESETHQVGFLCKSKGVLTAKKTVEANLTIQLEAKDELDQGKVKDGEHVLLSYTLKILHFGVQTTLK